MQLQFVSNDPTVLYRTLVGVDAEVFRWTYLRNMSIRIVHLNVEAEAMSNFDTECVNSL